MRFKSRYKEIEAVRWTPDPAFGVFDSEGNYRNIKIGVDALGVQYTIIEVGIYTISGFARLEPGDWIIAEDDGVHFYPCKPLAFESRWEPL